MGHWQGIQPTSKLFSENRTKKDESKKSMRKQGDENRDNTQSMRSKAAVT